MCGNILVTAKAGRLAVLNIWVSVKKVEFAPAERIDEERVRLKGHQF